MHFKILKDNISVGYLELTPEKFELKEFKSKEAEKFLKRLIQIYFNNGIIGGVDGDKVRTESISHDDRRFPLELSTRLAALDYILA